MAPCHIRRVREGRWPTPWITAAALAALVGTAGCRDPECDRALDVLCSCPGIDCDAADAPEAAAVLRRCDTDEIVGDRGYNLAVCISDSSRYCAVLTGLRTDPATVCDIECTQQTVCDLEQACHESQYSSCDLPGSPSGG